MQIQRTNNVSFGRLYKSWGNPAEQAFINRKLKIVERICPGIEHKLDYLGYDIMIGIKPDYNRARHFTLEVNEEMKNIKRHFTPLMRFGDDTAASFVKDVKYWNLDKELINFAKKLKEHINSIMN